MMIVACCCTYRRPRSLGYLIHCFERQTHPERFLLILDDSGEYMHQTGDRWELISVPRRFRTLGEKRNAVAALAPECDAFAVADDDDLYLPWWLEAHAAVLKTASWSRPSRVLYIVDLEQWRFRQHETGGLYHGGWAYRRELFDAAGWYPADSGPEDQLLGRKMTALQPKIGDPISLGYRPAYIYGGYAVSRRPNISRLGCNQVAYRQLGKIPSSCESLVIRSPSKRDLACPVIDPHIYPRPF